MRCVATLSAVAVDPERIGQAIRDARGARPQKEVAALAGLGADSLSDIENGKAEPKLSTLERLADALSVPLGALLLRAGAIDLSLPIEELLASDPDLSEDSRDLMRRLYERAKRFDREEGAVVSPPRAPRPEPADDGA